MNKKYVNAAIEIRRQLHAVPELALNETKTKGLLMKFVTENTNLTVTDCDNWFYACYEGTDKTQPIAIRADYDAVAGCDGTPGHFCGHDGHASVLAALALYISDTKPNKSVYLIFQPAEETGQGALLCRELLIQKGISSIFAFHNIPGQPCGSVMIRRGTFACASTGLEISIKGAPTHAGCPENGKNPSDIIANLILLKNKVLAEPHKGLVLVTIIGVEIGSSAYGVSASEGVLRLTLRAERGDEFEKLVSLYETTALEMCNAAQMKCVTRRIEEFAATENSESAVSAIEKAAQKAGKQVVYPAQPFRWSEDFGFYLQHMQGAYFGIGDGEDYPQLHTEGYEYPDACSETALDVYEALLQML